MMPEDMDKVVRDFAKTKEYLHVQNLKIDIQKLERLHSQTDNRKVKVAIERQIRGKRRSLRTKQLIADKKWSRMVDVFVATEFSNLLKEKGVLENG
jgi:hypothetical protein